jgi:hypothetical protein
VTLGQRARAFLLWIPQGFLVAAGAWLLVRTAVAASGGYDKLWLFGKMEQHRFTSAAMLTGTLRLRDGLLLAGHDEQVFNGATYTNWGFGVPLLQMPFHLAAQKMRSLPGKFFPDRAIYFVYLAAVIPVLWAAFDRLLALRPHGGIGRIRRHTLSWAAVLLTLVFTLYPLMSCRFLIYEETICYMMLFELLALAAYVFALPSWSSGAVAAMGAASGMGLLVRPTGLIALGVFGALVVLESPKKKAIAVFAAAVAPFVAFWLYTNRVRSGSPFSLGFSNALVAYRYHTTILRFGSTCVDTPRHMLRVASRLFKILFVELPDPALEDATSWMKQCHFDIETRPPSGEAYATQPFFGFVVFILVLWILLHHLARRDRRLSLYVPFAALVCLFASYVLAGSGFMWRYVGDFWPLIVLVCVQYVHTLPAAANRALGLRLAVVFVACGTAGFYSLVKPALGTLDTLTAETAPQWDAFTNSRWSMDPPVPTRLDCGRPLASIFKNGDGWASDCSVGSFTSVFVGVPFKRSDSYEIRYHVQGDAPPEARLYVNGKRYVARREQDAYVAAVQLSYATMTSPTVAATIEWSRDELAPPPLRLQSIEIE